jgi:hypothetical protein
MAWIPALAAMVAAAATSTAAPAPRLECSVSAPASVAVGRPVPLRFTLRNHGNAAVQVLTWATPFEGWFAPYVKVWRDGTELAYTGPTLKRGEPAPEDYLRIGAGRSRAVMVDLAQAFDLGRSGSYRVQPALNLHDSFVAAADRAPRPRDRHVGQIVPCGAAAFEVRDHAAPRRR